jgi:hypothetical protein
MKARIRKEKVGVKTYYYPQIEQSTTGEKKYLFWGKKVSNVEWKSIAHCFLKDGSVSWWKQLMSLYDAKEVLQNYEELFGIKLEITEDEN